MVYTQLNVMDCGPTCLRMIASHHGKNIPIDKIRKLADTTQLGSNLLGLSKAAEKLGFTSFGAKLDFDTLAKQANFPCIAYWEQKHFVVIVKITKNRITIADPKLTELITLSREEFLEKWKLQDQYGEQANGVVLILSPTKDFHKEVVTEELEDNSNWKFLYRYFKLYKKYIVQLIIGLFAGAILSLIVPFLTQSIVDIGIQNSDISFVYLVLIGQLFLFIGRMVIEVIRSWLLIHFSTRINISLISDFFIKLMRLPSFFFDNRLTGDLLQRIRDHYRLENLLTTSSLSVVFSFINILIFSIVLLIYNLNIFLIFLFFSVIYIGWIILFLKRRKVLDYLEFGIASDEQEKVLELIGGMQEIKMYNAEISKRWSWERIQYKLFKLRTKRLGLEQYQSVGAGFINELKNILITIYSANLVISGEITLGMMLSITYIIGQLNSPILSITSFIHSLQDAKIAMERIQEVYSHENEEEDGMLLKDFETEVDIKLKGISFKYPGAETYALKNINLTIPHKKVTAFVGASGSGKSTLMKLLIKNYLPTEGEILVGNTSLNHISFESWREKCGAVMQEGFIFNDSIERNIAVEEYIDTKRIHKAAKMAHIADTIEKLPISYKTKIGSDGIGMSTGQKQRLFISRVLYKDPQFVFLDEATSSLDANNEKDVMNDLTSFFEDKTVVIIAHRLSTVQNADQIVVIDQGEVLEIGEHKSLLAKKGAYHNLVKNQLNLDIVS